MQQGLPEHCVTQRTHGDFSSSKPPSQTANSRIDDELQISTEGDTGSDEARRTGDLAVYNYYLRMIGWRAATAYLLLCAAYIAIVNFSRKLLEFLSRGRLTWLTHVKSRLAPKMDQRQCGSSERANWLLFWSLRRDRCCGEYWVSVVRLVWLRQTSEDCDGRLIDFQSPSTDYAA